MKPSPLDASQYLRIYNELNLIKFNNSYPIQLTIFNYSKNLFNEEEVDIAMQGILVEIDNLSKVS